MRFSPSFTAIALVAGLTAAAFGPAGNTSLAQETGSTAPTAAMETPQPAAMPALQMENMNTVVLRTIDKLSARTHTFDIPVGKTVKFGQSLFIKVRACRKSSPLDKPEAASFLQIWERKPDEDESRWVFSGWMFASSPSLSAMDHPVYDVWVIACKNSKTSEKSPEEFSAEQSPGNTPDAAAATSSRPSPVTPSGPVAKPVATAVPPVPEERPSPPDEIRASVPTLDQLPGSFDDGSDVDTPTPLDAAPED